MTDETVIHASCVALNGRGLLISGASGAGKSSLALVLMGFGADLVADDRTCLERRDGVLWASCPPAIRGRIEARGVGILSAAGIDGAAVAAEVDLDAVEPLRLPPERRRSRAGCEIPLILGGGSDRAGLSFAAALLQYLKAERCA